MATATTIGVQLILSKPEAQALERMLEIVMHPGHGLSDDDRPLLEEIKDALLCEIGIQ